MIDKNSLNKRELKILSQLNSISLKKKIVLSSPKKQEFINNLKFKRRENFKISKFSRLLCGIIILIRKNKEKTSDIANNLVKRGVDDDLIVFLLTIAKSTRLTNILNLHYSSEIIKIKKRKRKNKKKKTIGKQFIRNYFWSEKFKKLSDTKRKKKIKKLLVKAACFKIRRLNNFIGVIKISEFNNNYFLTLKNKLNGNVYYTCSSGMVKARGKEKATPDSFFKLIKLFIYKITPIVKRKGKISLIELEIDSRLPLTMYNTLIFRLLKSRIKKRIFCYNYLNKDSHNGLRPKKKRRI